MFMKIRRARFFAKFTLSRQSEILRYAQDDSEGLRMAAGKRFSAAREAPPFQFRGEKSWLKAPFEVLAIVGPKGQTPFLEFTPPY
ncbi:MAG: hypothetical protein ABSF14_22625 [Terriglobia bacterium]|jgi:hypothetical protein